MQLYQDQDFLNRAVCRFAGAALANGEGIILVPTLAHWNAIRPRLEAEGVDVEAARQRGQLTVVDADELLPRFMRDAMPDSPVFLGLAADVIARARAGGSYSKVRWWGEMVNVLWERGDVAASMNLEDLFDQLAHKHDIAIFCSFLMDNFDGNVHAHMLPRLGENHSHLIPVEDYARLERAVADALRDTVGPDEARVLEIEVALAVSGAIQHASRPGLAAGVAPCNSHGCRRRPAEKRQLVFRNGQMTAGPVASSDRTASQQLGSEAVTANSATVDLAGILDAVDLPMLVILHDFTIAYFNQAGGNALSLTQSDIGRSAHNLPLLSGLPDLRALCAQVIAVGAPQRHDLRDGNKSFVVRIAPYVKSDGQINGTVLTFTNATAFRASIDQAIYEREYTKTILNTVATPLIVLDADLRVQAGNRAFYTMFGVSREQSQGVQLSELGHPRARSRAFAQAVGGCPCRRSRV